MNLALIYSRAQRGITAPVVRVEVNIGGGLPRMNIVGLPATAVRESKDRVEAAIKNSQFTFPDGKITVNLAPADLPKEGGRFDLPIAVGILVASGQVPAKALDQLEFVGELALTGDLRPVNGAFSAALVAGREGRSLVVSPENAADAALAPGARVLTADNLLQLSAHLQGTRVLETVVPSEHHRLDAPPDMADIRGQAGARRALEIAAAGAHNILMVGPPGTGKSMLAERIPGVLPPPSEAETLEILAIASAHHGNAPPGLGRQRPFRNPHHSASTAAMVGGGSYPRPGEISLAHAGVLFLDEIPEFPRGALECMREPMETGEIVISRINQRVVYPAHFQLVAAMNPCPCGYDGDPHHQCRCTPDQINRYRNRISGPLLDRIDIQVRVPRLKASTLADPRRDGEPSTDVAERVQGARERQLQRAGKANSGLSSTETHRYCKLTATQRKRLLAAVDSLGLSARAYHRLLRVARTIADLEAADDLADNHINEALAFRSQGVHAHR